MGPPRLQQHVSRTLVARNDMTLSGVTRRASARVEPRGSIAGSLSIEPFARSRWRVRRTRRLSCYVFSINRLRQKGPVWRRATRGRAKQATNQAGSSRASQSSSAKWIRSHTPARCQSRKRRQHVIPDPHPSSCGSICQGIPLRRRRQCRSSMRDPTRAVGHPAAVAAESARTVRQDPTTDLESAARPYSVHATSSTGSGFGGFVTRF
jgi:hypothetical protein